MKRTPKKNTDGEKRTAHLFSPSVKIDAAPKNAGAASRTLTPLAHGALRGNLAKKVRQRTAACPKHNPDYYYLYHYCYQVRGAWCILQTMPGLYLPGIFYYYQQATKYQVV